MRQALASILPLLFLAACTRYEHALVEPADLARHIGSRSDEVIPLEPLTYRLRSYDNRLIIHVENPNDDPIRLIGDQSYVVDPNGQSHPLRSQTAAPHSFIKLILPPPRPYYRGSNFGFGIGVGVGHIHHHHRHWGHGHYHSFHGPPWYDPWFDEPQYYTLYEPGDPTYWNWEGETDVKLNLVYQRGDRTFKDQFTFHRKKM